MNALNCVLIITAATILSLLSSATFICCSLSSGPLERGFQVSPSQITLHWESFRPFLTSPEGNFSLGFQQVSSNGYVLSIMYTIRDIANTSSSELEQSPVSIEMVWSANGNSTCSKDASCAISEQGSLTLTDGGLQIWSAGTGDTLNLEDTGNLAFISGGMKTTWQSFDYPTDTLLPGQNFTASMRLTAPISSTVISGVYYLKMEANGMAMYANLGETTSDMMYWKLYAGQETAQINPEGGPLYARIQNMGYLGMYQTEQARVSYVVFNTYNWASVARRRMKLGGDGNLMVYYWDNDSSWKVDYEGVKETCDLPYPCGPYGVCKKGEGCVCPTGDVVNMRSSNSSASMDTNSSLMFSSANSTDYQQGCVVLQPVEVDGSSCSEQRVYMRVEDVDTVFNGDINAMARANASSETDCEALCGVDCTCVSFAYRNGSLRNCFLVHEVAVSLQESSGHVSYIKVSSPPLRATSKAQNHHGNTVAIKISVAIASCFLVGLLVSYLYLRSRRYKATKEEKAALRTANSFDRGIELLLR